MALATFQVFVIVDGSPRQHWSTMKIPFYLQPTDLNTIPQLRFGVDSSDVFLCVYKNTLFYHALCSN